MIKLIRSKLFEIMSVLLVVVFLFFVKIALDAIYNPAPAPTQESEIMDVPPLPEDCDTNFLIPSPVALYNSAVESGILEDYASAIGVIGEDWFMIDGVLVLRIKFITGMDVSIALFALCGEPANASPLIDVYVSLPE